MSPQISFGLIDKIHVAVTEAECWYEVRPLSPDHKGNPDEEYVLPDICAVGCHCSGDIWIVTVTESECDFLARSAHRWLPLLSDQLNIYRKTYPVLVHGMPTTFNPSRDSSHIASFLNENSDIITHPSML